MQRAGRLSIGVWMLARHNRVVKGSEWQRWHRSVILSCPLMTGWSKWAQSTRHHSRALALSESMGTRIPDHLNHQCPRSQAADSPGGRRPAVLCDRHSLQYVACLPGEDRCYRLDRRDALRRQALPHSNRTPHRSDLHCLGCRESAPATAPQASSPTTYNSGPSMASRTHQRSSVG